jgi:hypothetical protein
MAFASILHFATARALPPILVSVRCTERKKIVHRKTAMEINTVGVEEWILLKEVRSVIYGLGYVRLRRIVCHCKDKTVLLEGVVDSYYMKQITYAAASKVPGVEAVIDQIVVADE